MHPLSTAVILLGSAIAVPIAFKFATVAKNGNRLAFAGHQTGVLVALLGWLLSGRISIGVGHAVWFAAAQGWYSWTNRRATRA